MHLHFTIDITVSTESHRTGRMLKVYVLISYINHKYLLNKTDSEHE